MGDQHHYQNALRYQEEGRWRDALAELKQGAAEGDGMCCWWLCFLHDINGLWGFSFVSKHDYNALIDKGKDTNARCMAMFVMENARSIQKYEPLILTSGDHYAVSNYYKYQLLRGVTYEAAIDVGTRYEESLRQAAESRDFMGLYYYGNCRDEDRRWALELSAQKGFALAQTALARKLLDKDRVDEASVWLRKAAEQQYRDAQVMLCTMLRVRKNYAALLYWLKRVTESIIPQVREDAFGELEDMKEHFEKIEHCRSSCFALMAIRCCPRKSALSILPKDVVKLIAKALWLTRDDDAWSDAAFGGGGFNKKINI